MIDNDQPDPQTSSQEGAPREAEPNYLEVGVADYYNRKVVKASSMLAACVPDVLIIAYCEGAPEAARYFAERLGVEVTEKMIKTVKSKVRRSILKVTHEQLVAAAQSHPHTAARLLSDPSMADPQSYGAPIESVSTSARKPTRKTTARIDGAPRAPAPPPPATENVPPTTVPPARESMPERSNPLNMQGETVTYKGRELFVPKGTSLTYEILYKRLLSRERLDGPQGK